MTDLMRFPKTVDEFMEKYKIVDTEEVYTNGAELVPIFRMKQWFEHAEAEPVRHGYWSLNPHNRAWDVCSVCGIGTKRREYGINPDGSEYVTEWSWRYCPNCGAKMDEVEDAE